MPRKRIRRKRGSKKCIVWGCERPVVAKVTTPEGKEVNVCELHLSFYKPEY